MVLSSLRRVLRINEPSVVSNKQEREYFNQLIKTLRINFQTLENRLDEDLDGFFNNVVVVKDINDFPSPVSSIITLKDNTAYFIDGSVNIGENRILCGLNNVLFGFSPEISYLSNTLDNQSLITGDETLSLWRISLYVEGTGATIFDLDASTSTQSNSAIDWEFVNFSGGDIGTIANYDNCIFNTIGYIDKSGEGCPALGTGITFDGTIGTIAFTDSLFVVSGSGNTALNLPSTLTITRRVRLSDCAVVASSSAVGVSASTSMTIPDEGFVLQNVNFSGGATYLSGLDYTYNAARIEACRGITNSYVAGYYTMTGNATATTIGATATPVKVAGTTVSQSVSSKFTNTTSNRTTYTGALDRLVKVTAIVTLTSGNNNQIGVYIAKNGTVIDESETYLTANSAGRLENGAVQTLAQVSTNDYFEIFVENNTATTDITVEDMSVVVTEV